MNPPPKNLVKAKHADILLLCQNMRPDEIEQMQAFFDLDEYDADAAALILMNKQGPKFTLLDNNGHPVCSGGWEPVGHGIMQSWMVGTMAGWDRHWRSITKSSRWLMDTLLDNGIRRLQTNALASRVDACRWYTDGLKMQPEGIWRKYGRQGQDVAAFARVAED